MNEIDNSNGVMFPFYDQDTSVIYLCGKVSVCLCVCLSPWLSIYYDMASELLCLTIYSVSQNILPAWGFFHNFSTMAENFKTKFYTPIVCLYIQCMLHYKILFIYL